MIGKNSRSHYIVVTVAVSIGNHTFQHGNSLCVSSVLGQRPGAERGRKRLGDEKGLTGCWEERRKEGRRDGREEGREGGRFISCTFFFFSLSSFLFLQAIKCNR